MPRHPPPDQHSYLLGIDRWRGLLVAPSKHREQSGNDNHQSDLMRKGLRLSRSAPWSVGMWSAYPATLACFSRTRCRVSLTATHYDEGTTLSHDHAAEK